MTLRVLTLNLWNINEPLAERLAALSAGLKVLRPDIVCFQEADRDPHTKRRHSAVAAEACALAHCVEDGGLAILSRYPLTRTASLALPDAPADEPRKILMAEVLLNGRPMLVADTHLAWRPEAGAERKTQIDVALAAITEFCGKPCAKLLCGDFNDDPDSPAVCRVLDCGFGFRDTFAVCRPGDPGYTWALANPYVEQEGSRNQRIDYIFANGDLKPRQCGIVFDGAEGLAIASDHYGVFCEFAV